MTGHEIDLLIKRIAHGDIEALECLYMGMKKPVVYKSQHRLYHFAALTLSLCLIIAVCVFAWPSLKNNSNLGINNGNTSSSDSVNIPSNINVAPDKIIWNNSGSMLRLAGTFEKVLEKEWLEKYPIKLPQSKQFDYFLVYSIPKNGDSNTSLIFGHLLNKISDSKWFSAYFLPMMILHLRLMILNFTNLT